jgi:hypothetical protein
MFKNTYKLVFLLMITLSGIAQERYDKIRVWSDDTSEIVSELLGMGIDPEGMEVRRGVYVDVVVNQIEKFAVEGHGLEVEELILDVSTFYASRLTQGASRELGYGSMGGYLTYNEIVSSMDTLHSRFPEIVSARQSFPNF